ncbi:MAG TPA: PA14 domain-containing protein [Bacillota bacterium]|nr:PA14 domain-containing protein [Bacillota bacterium]
MKKRRVLAFILILLMILANISFASAISADPNPDPDDMAVYLKGNFSGGNSAAIEGDLYTALGNVQISGTMQSTGDFYHKTGTSYNYPGWYDDSYPGYGAKNKVLAATVYNESFPTLAEFPSIGNYVPVASNQNQSLVISQDTHFGELKISSNASGRDVVFDVQTKDLFVVADKLSITVWKEINVVGTHTLFLYVNDYFGGNSKIKPFLLSNPSGNPNQIYIISKDYLPLNAGTPLIGHLLYSGIANLTTGGYAAVTGSVITDAANVSISGSDPFHGLFYAPYAAVSMGGSAMITGRLVADSLNMTGSAKIVYSDQYSTLSLPDEILPPKYTVNTAVYPLGAGTITPASAEIEVGQSIHFTVTPAGGYTFTGFTSSDPSMVPDEGGNLTVTGNVTITANFEPTGGGSGYAGGLLGEYYDSKEPVNPTALKMKRIDSSIAFNYGYDLSPDPVIGHENFSVRWTGYIKPAVTGDYIFKTYSDDGVKLFVNNVKLIDNWGLFTLNFELADNSIHLEAGQYYPITLEYQQGPLYSAVFLFWESNNGVSMGLVPGGVLYVTQETHDEYSPAKYYNPLEKAGTGFINKFYTPAGWISDTPEAEEISSIDYAWGLSAPGDIGTDKFYGRMEGDLETKYTEPTTLIFTVDDALKVWVDNVLVINEWDWHNHETFEYTFNAVAGEKYRIKAEYADFGLGATIVMGWRSDALGSEVIPKEYMYNNLD